ncbi:uncharacterized protein LOC114973588 [Acropora millepora]|uniref:uncharacterized protein LOC114973588 n=1 Tax=Acropora millepora TaxID=45264 RepID=UPI001CF4D700|nr:uncharacterized protein LOC114973588 [Acropora millepora]
MKFIVCVTFLFLCTPGFSRTKAVDGNEKKGEAEGYKRAVKKPDVDQCTENCYLKYFGNGFVPTGLDLSMSAQMSCICQEDDKGNDCFATYFYDDAGIAAYSAYTIQASDATKIGKYERPKVPWKTTPGITKQGTDALYRGSSAYNIDRGHLNPNHINSYNQDYQIATFKYTNAVPQFANHNRQSWMIFEHKIADYVKADCGGNGGTMYLITGTSKYLRSTTGQQLPGKIELFPPSDPNGIVRPNSLWTAGCCVFSSTNGESLAVWGNNDKASPYTVSLSLPDLEKLLVTSSSSPANIFPAFPQCRKKFHML